MLWIVFFADFFRVEHFVAVAIFGVLSSENNWAGVSFPLKLGEVSNKQ
jgi:hypothetical protein